MDSFRDLLITGRTQADVDRVRYLAGLWDPTVKTWRGTKEEAAEWLSGPKGAYNAKDLNRVTLAASYVLTELSQAGYRIPEGIHPAYMVSVFIDPPGSGNAQGTLFYEGGPVTVRAEPTGESRFLGWEEDGKLVSREPSYTFTAAENRKLTAKFEAEWVMASSIVGSGRIGKAVLGRSWR